MVSKGNTYYFDSDGKKVTGWQTIRMRSLYCFDEKELCRDPAGLPKMMEEAYLTDEGKALSGWQTINEKNIILIPKGL